MKAGDICKYSNKVNDVLEDIQKAQVDAGGRFFRRKEIEDMKVVDLLCLLIPNEVEFKIKHKRK